MKGKFSVVIEQDEHGCYAGCPVLKGCQSQGKTVGETLTNIREAIELFLETQEPNYRLNGFTHRKPSNRAKSPSVEQRSSPCSIARAARWASGISFAPPPSRIKRRPSISWWRLPGSGTQALRALSQCSTCPHATFTGAGLS